MDISVVVPIFNEADNIAPLGNKLIHALEPLNRNYEILFINDGSSDRSAEELSKLKKSFSNRVMSYSLANNSGQSAAFEVGFAKARGRILVTLDGDLQNDPQDIPRMLEALEGYDMVCGIRQNRRDSWVRRLSSKIANAVRNKMTQDHVTDVGCSLRVFRKEIIQGVLFFDGFHRFFPTLVKLKHPETRIQEIVVNHHPRQFGVSKYTTLNRLFRSLYDLMGVRWMQKRHLKYEIEDTQ